MRILIFGDSITQGYYDLDKGGWAQRLLIDNLTGKERNPRNVNEFFNLGVSGNFTPQVTQRIASETKTRLWGDEPVVAVIAIGFNDAVVEDGQPHSSPQQYARDLQALYEQAHPVTDKLLFVGLTTVDESQSAPWQFNSGTSKLVWQNDRIWQFEQTLRHFVKEKSLPFVPVWEGFQQAQNGGQSLHSDGIHPNAAGHQLIATQVQTQLVKLL